MNRDDWRKCTAEALGTFALVFVGTGSMVINDLYGGVVTHVGVSLTWGLIVAAMVYSLGDVSGAHINPAVSLGLFLAKRFEGRLVVPYILSQCLGALAASSALRILFPDHPTLGASLPSGSALQSLLFEFFLTFLLMFVILYSTTGSKEKVAFAGVAIGAVITLEALFAGPICGASMNPARSLAPALVSGKLAHLWIYLTAPIAGASLAVAVSHFLGVKHERHRAPNVT
jgi:MIP family channel proteins